MNVLVSVRPEQWRVHGRAGGAQLAGTVKMVMPLGPHVVYDVEIPGGTSIKISQSRETAAALLESGSTIHFAPLSAAACHVFHAEMS